MTNKTSAFERAVSQVRTAVRRRLRNNTTISSVDVVSAAPSFRGARRGAVIRTAFRQLESEGVIRPTDETVYNARIRHSVTVYRRSGR
jgi:hypothetical protein